MYIIQILDGGYVGQFAAEDDISYTKFAVYAKKFDTKAQADEYMTLSTNVGRKYIVLGGIENEDALFIC